MKNVLTLIAIIAVGWGLFTLAGKPATPDGPSPLSQWMQQYESVIVKYEQQGVTTNEDRTNMVSELAALASVLPTLEIKGSEAEQYKAKTEELGTRQTKLISTTEVEVESSEAGD